MKKKTILLCYFGPKFIAYTQTDIGYIIAILKEKHNVNYDFEIIQLNYSLRGNEVDFDTEKKRQEFFIQKDVDLIEYHNPDAVFIFIENVLWSKVFALGRAKKIIYELRKRKSELFIGLQSWRIQNNQINILLGEGYADCVIVGDPESIFLCMDQLLLKEYIPGVRYKENTYIRKNLKAYIGNIDSTLNHSFNTLDHIPSPYLSHVFDNHIQTLQHIFGEQTRAFLVSSRGCRFGCYYCFRSTKFEKIRYFSPQRFYDELEYLFNTFHIKYFFVLDDAFLYSRKRLEEFEQEFKKRIVRNPGLSMISLSIMARPETVNEEIIKILKILRVDSIQFGLQTVNPDIQHYMRRKIDIIYFKSISKWMKKYEMRLFLDIVVGLPGDSIEWCKETLRFALLLDPYFLQVKQMYLVPNTLFYVKQKEYDILTEAVERDFNTPYLVRAKNIDENYFNETNSFIMNQIKENTHINWKYIANKDVFFTAEHFDQSLIELRNSKRKYYHILWHLKNNTTRLSKEASQKAFVIDNEYIYVMTDNRYLTAIDQINGRVVWEFAVHILRQKKQTSSLPIICDRRIYFGGSDKNIHCVDIKTGEQIWVCMLADWTGSPIIAAPKLQKVFTGLEFGFLRKRTKVVAIDSEKGTISWTYPIGNTCIVSLLFVYEKELLIFGNNKGVICALDVNSGVKKWIIQTSGIMKDSFVFDKKRSQVLFVTSDGILSSINIKEERKQDIFKPQGTISSKIVLYEDCIFLIFENKNVVCFDLETRELKWQFDTKEDVYNQLTIIDENVFLSTLDGALYEIDSHTGRYVSQFSIQQRYDNILYNPFKKRFFTMTQSNNLYCFVRVTSSHIF